MNEKEKTLNELKAFRTKEKFSASAWEARGLNPSEDAICSTLEDMFNTLADEMIESVNANADQNQIRTILETSLNSVDSWDYDTEEREFIADTYYELAQIFDLNISDNLNQWMYGW